MGRMNRRMPMLTDVPAEALHFAAAEARLEAGGEGPRRFSGVAYTGDVLRHPFWGFVAFDLESVRFVKPLPVLLGHEPEQNAGVATRIAVTGRGIEVSGHLLDNEFGRKIAHESAQDFPWRMSVFIEPESIEEVEAGFEINGRAFPGKGVVFRGGLIREASFTAVPVDAGTHAHAFSTTWKDITAGDAGKEEAMNEKLAALEAEKAELERRLAAEKERFDAAQSELEALKAELREARERELNQLFAGLGIQGEEAEASRAALLEMDGTRFAAVCDLMRKTRETRGRDDAPAHLFSEQHVPAGEGARTDLAGEIAAAYQG